MILEDCLIYLIGKPGSGKYTIAKALAEQTKANLIDNHKINNLIFDFVKLNDDNAHILWRRIDRIREVVLETITDSRPEKSSFILTNVLMADDPDDIKWYDEIEHVAQKSSLRFFPVVLTPSNTAIKNHISVPERKARHKIADVDFFEKNFENRDVYIPQYRDTLVIDNHDLGVQGVIDKILANGADKK